MLYIEGNCETQISFMFRLEFYLQDFSLNCKKKMEKVQNPRQFWQLWLLIGQHRSSRSMVTLWPFCRRN